ncbi:hypothetical protein BTH42_28650 [Burkholderia sp. SRS-W-2-2016]|uniref:hypothetical protein n=1 Tax=Burkholderia sp. SRS-W-2-2016 TaxID=1926878 RepID=UPI00094AD74D|nr:hypothetical protein [Burkholderia sp. SRS-W-2-2016]OLL28241.1 hypothetical protein BTH42_28650 [Burkholderia sp. SRS-W-2-2016]
MTAAFNAIEPAGTNSYPVGSGQSPAACVSQDVGCFEPHPWGGVPGIFKKLTDEAGLNYVVSLSTRNAASLRGHFLNTANTAWDLRGDIASQKWDVVVLQGQSDEPLPAGKAKNANFPQFSTYASRIAEYIQTGQISQADTNGQTTEAQIFGGLENCMAATSANPPGPGLSRTACNAVRTIPLNLHANPNAKIYLEQMWARPDMVEAHQCTKPDLTTMDGTPIVDPTCSNGANGDTVTAMNAVYYTSKSSTAANLNDITADMRTAMNTVVASSGRLAGVVPVGDAFQRAVDTSVVKTSGFYDAAGIYSVSPTQMELWWKDRTHASVYGSYLKALVLFGRLTGKNPAALGIGEQAAADMGISEADASTLQKIASDSLRAAGYPLE